MQRVSPKTLKEQILQLNLFEKEFNNETNTRAQLISTRIYIVSLICSLFLVCIVSSLIVRTLDKTEDSPLLASFERLIKDYSANLQCPCSQIGIAYQTFATIHVHYHQVCTSEFIHEKWITRLFDQRKNSSIKTDDFQQRSSFFWQTISDFCHLSEKAWMSVERSSSSLSIFSPLAISKDLLRINAEEALNTEMGAASERIRRNLFLIQRTISGNQFVSALETNFYLRGSNPSRMAPKKVSNCSCMASDGCPHPLSISGNENRSIPIPGMIEDCYIIDGVLASTLQCYYNRTCFALLHPHLSNSFEILSGNIDQGSYPNQTIRSLFNRMMVDHFTIRIDFDKFYQQCQPRRCSYSFQRRFDLIFILTTVLGVFGGLSLVLRYISKLIAQRMTRPHIENVFHTDVHPNVQIRRWKCSTYIYRSFQSYLVQFAL